MTQYQMVEIKPAAARLFATRDGELVLNYLKFKFYDCRIKEETMAQQVGAREVLRFIQQLMEEAKNVQK